MKKPCYVILSSCGNPDFGQHPDMELFGAEPNSVRPISSFKEASDLCNEFIRGNELGSGNWSGGNILDENKEPFAQVSYNSKVWEDVSYSKGRKEIVVK